MQSKIAFIQTGGTIDKDYPRKIKGYAFEIHKPAFEKILKRINPLFEYSVYNFSKKDSQEITNADRKDLIRFISNLDTDKVIVTHGTDTIIETAVFFKEIKNKTVVLTGSFIPEAFKNSDADFNLGMAVSAVQTLSSGIYIVIQGAVFGADNVLRNTINGNFEKIK
jgi:L-asparaginase